MRTVGDLLGTENKINTRIAEFDEAARAFRAKHAARLKSQSIALVRFTAEDVRILTGVIFGSDVLQRAGVKRPPSNTPAEADATFISLSQETVDVLDDADVIIYFSGGGGWEAEADEYETGGPLWRRLPAVDSGRAFKVDQLVWWDGYSPAAGLACLKDLDRIVGQL